MKRVTFTYILFTLLLTACGGSQPASTATPAPSNTPIPTSTQTPSPTPIPPPPIISASNVMNLQEDFRIGQGAVSDAVWLPDGNVALVYSTGVSIYDPDTGDLIKSVEPENKAIGASIISPDGKRVAALLYKDNKVLVWDANTGKIEYELETRCQVYNFLGQEIAFNGDGSLLAICDEEGVSLWDLSNGTKIHIFKIKRKDYLSMAFNPKNNTLATIGSANIFTDVAIWDLASGEVIKKLPQTSSWTALNIRFNHQGNILAWKGFGGSKGSGIYLYDIKTNQMVQTIYDGGYSVFEFSPDDKTLTLGGVYGKGVRLLDTATGEFITEPNNSIAYLIKYSPDGSRFVAGRNDFFVFKNVGDVESKRLGTFEKYNQIAFDPSGKYISTGGNYMALWDLHTKKQTLDHISASENYIATFRNNFLFTPNGDGFITTWNNNTGWAASIQQWDINTENKQSFEGTIADSLIVNKPPLLSPSGDLLAIGIPYNQPFPSFAMNGATYIRFWDVNSKKNLFDIKQLFLSDYEFSPDGNIFASAGEKTIYFWDLYTQKPSKQLDCPTNIYDIAFSPDGALIAAAAFNGVYIWDTNSGKLISEFNEHEIRAATQVAFSPQGNILAAIGYDKDLHKLLFAMDLSNNKLLYKITGDKDNNAFITNSDIRNFADKAGLLFSPGGSFIVTSGLKRQRSYEYVQFWDTSSGQLIKTLEYTVGINSLSPYENPFGFSPDGRLFAIADGTVHILHIAASNDNGKEDVVPTSIPTLPPLPTAAPTVTPTPAPTVAVESIFPNLRAVETETFDNSNSPKWQLDPSAAKIKDGSLEIKGMNWKGVSRALGEGDGIIVNFKFTQDAWFVINLAPEVGEHSVSVVLYGGKFADVMTRRGSNETHKPLSGNLDSIPGNWYSMLMTIGKKGEILIRIWDPADPLKTIEYRDILGSDWVGIPYIFGAGGETGTIWFDDFKEVKSMNASSTPLPTVTPKPPQPAPAWDFNQDGNFEGWQVQNQLDPLQTNMGNLVTKSTGNDPYMVSQTISVDAPALARIEIRMKISAGDTAELYFITNSESEYSESKVFRFPITSDGKFHAYILDMSKVKKWSGEITQIRLDPTIAQADIEIDYIHILP